jgi:TRAP-type C4-dicarboxylate transport system permease small subunit
MKILKWLNTAIMVFTGIMLGIMTTLVMLQVIWRYILQMPFPESQELAVYAMVYVVMFGSTIAVYKKSHIAVNFIIDKLPVSLAFVLKLVAYGFLIFFFYLLIKEGWGLSMRSMRQLSPTTGIPVGYIMASLPISSAISMLYVLEQLYNEVRGFIADRRKTGDAS